ncbi:MAG: BON domain-containing protein [Chloroherpetonaceae bacterium]|nr:BON domain-containing protein [Chloroherpetonaceae bacterium]MDW8436767.1 BON domain-containing protein [Chloroherpetonaceae bacterium]
MTSKELPTSEKASKWFSKKWVWGAIGIASAFALGVALSRRGLPSFSRKTTRSPKPFSETLAAEWQLIEKIDRALAKARITGIEVYVKNGKVLLVAPAEHQRFLADARDVILAVEGVQRVETSVKETPLSASSSAR